MENEKNYELVPYCIVEEIRAMIAQVQEQLRVTQQMIHDDQVARMSTEYLDLEQASKVLHCKAKTLERLRMRGEIAFYQYGKKIGLRRADIDAFIEAHMKNRDFIEKLEAEPRIEFGTEENGDGMEE